MKIQKRCVLALGFTVMMIGMVASCNGTDKKTDITGVWSLITESEWTKYYGFDTNGMCCIGGRSMSFMDGKLFFIECKPYQPGKGAIELGEQIISLIKMDDEILPIVHLQGDELKKQQQDFQINDQIITMKIKDRIWMLRKENGMSCDDIKNAPKEEK